MTNYELDKRGNLVYAHTNGVLGKWSVEPKATNNFTMTTKDFDFNEPARRKSIYKIYMTYLLSTQGAVQIQYAVDGSGEFTPVPMYEPVDSPREDGIIPTTNENPGKPVAFKLKLPNVYSLRFKVLPATIIELDENDEPTVINQAVPSSFEINDISIVYRVKGVN